MLTVLLIFVGVVAIWVFLSKRSVILLHHKCMQNLDKVLHSYAV